MQSQCDRRVNQIAVVWHADPLIPKQSVAPGQHFSQQLLQKMTKLARYFHWSVVLLQLCFLFRYSELTLFPLSSGSLLLIHFLSLSVQVHAFSLERPFIQCTQRNAVIHPPAATVQYVCAFWILIVGGSINVSVTRTVDKNTSICCCLFLLHPPPPHSNLKLESNC